MSKGEHMWRYWRVHFTNDPPTHWVSIDCGALVTEPGAVKLAERSFTDRGPVTNAIQDPARR